MSYKIISQNKKAYFNYEILETIETGIVLTGLEIKAIRAGKINLEGAHARILFGQGKKPELFLINANITTTDKTDNSKSRKLLVHREQIDHLIGKIGEKKLVLVPTKIYFKNGKAKVEIALGRGKKLHDKRENIKKRDIERESQRNF